MSNLKREVKECTLTNKGHVKENKDTIIDLEADKWKVHHNKRLIKLLSLMNLKNDKKHSSNEEIIKILNRFRPLSAEEDSEEIIDEDFSDVAIGNLKVIKKKKKEKKKKRTLKSKAKFNTSKTIRGYELRHNQKKYFKKKKERDEISI